MVAYFVLTLLHAARMPRAPPAISGISGGDPPTCRHAPELPPGNGAWPDAPCSPHLSPTFTAWNPHRNSTEASRSNVNRLTTRTELGQHPRKRAPDNPNQPSQYRIVSPPPSVVWPSSKRSESSESKQRVGRIIQGGHNVGETWARSGGEIVNISRTIPTEYPNSLA